MLKMLDLGPVAYAAYGEAVGGKNVRGEDLPAWEDLGPAVQMGWFAAVAAVSGAMTAARNGGK